MHVLANRVAVAYTCEYIASRRVYVANISASRRKYLRIYRVASHVLANIASPSHIHANIASPSQVLANISRHACTCEYIASRRMYLRIYRVASHVLANMLCLASDILKAIISEQKVTAETVDRNCSLHVTFWGA